MSNDLTQSPDLYRTAAMALALGPMFGPLLLAAAALEVFRGGSARLCDQGRDGAASVRRTIDTAIYGAGQSPTDLDTRISRLEGCIPGILKIQSDLTELKNSLATLSMRIPVGNVGGDPAKNKKP